MAYEPQGAIMENTINAHQANEYISVFNVFDIFYTSSTRTFNPLNISSEHKQIINSYKAPSEDYLVQRSQSKNANDIEIESLKYIIID